MGSEIVKLTFHSFQAPGLRWLRHGDAADAGAATAGAAGPLPAQSFQQNQSCKGNFVFTSVCIIK